MYIYICVIFRVLVCMSVYFYVLNHVYTLHSVFVLHFCCKGFLLDCLRFSSLFYQESTATYELHHRNIVGVLLVDSIIT